MQVDGSNPNRLLFNQFPPQPSCSSSGPNDPSFNSEEDVVVNGEPSSPFVAPLSPEEDSSPTAVAPLSPGEDSSLTATLLSLVNTAMKLADSYGHLFDQACFKVIEFSNAHQTLRERNPTLAGQVFELSKRCQDNQTTRFLAVLAALQGNTEACIQAGNDSEQLRDVLLAISLWKMARCEPKAQEYLSKYCRNDIASQTEVELLKLIPFSDAIKHLVYSTLYGNTISEQCASFSQLLQLAKDGDTSARYTLGYLYFIGVENVIDKDEGKAMLLMNTPELLASHTRYHMQVKPIDHPVISIFKSSWIVELVGQFIKRHKGTSIDDIMALQPNLFAMIYDFANQKMTLALRSMAKGYEGGTMTLPQFELTEDEWIRASAPTPQA